MIVLSYPTYTQREGIKNIKLGLLAKEGVGGGWSVIRYRLLLKNDQIAPKHIVSNKLGLSCAKLRLASAKLPTSLS